MGAASAFSVQCMVVLRLVHVNDTPHPTELEPPLHPAALGEAGGESAGGGDPVARHAVSAATGPETAAGDASAGPGRGSWGVGGQDAALAAREPVTAAPGNLCLALGRGKGEVPWKGGGAEEGELQGGKGDEPTLRWGEEEEARSRCEEYGLLQRPADRPARIWDAFIFNDEIDLLEVPPPHIRLHHTRTYATIYTPGLPKSHSDCTPHRRTHAKARTQKNSAHRNTRTHGHERPQTHSQDARIHEGTDTQTQRHARRIG